MRLCSILSQFESSSVSTLIFTRALKIITVVLSECSIVSSSKIGSSTSLALLLSMVKTSSSVSNKFFDSARAIKSTTALFLASLTAESRARIFAKSGSSAAPK